MDWKRAQASLQLFPECHHRSVNENCHKVSHDQSVTCADVLGDDKLPKTFCSIRPPLSTVNEIGPFFVVDTVWSSRLSHWLITAPWKTAPWHDGCSTYERGTQCVSIVNRQPWTLWVSVVLEMAWILMGKRGKWVERLFFLSFFFFKI